MTALTAILLFTALSFLGYGLSCLFSPHMIVEFQRYGVPQFRRLTGVLQVLAAVGLFMGLLVPWVAGVAAAGLALQMACGLAVRIKIGDAWYLCLPAGAFFLICTWLATRLL